MKILHVYRTFYPDNYGGIQQTIKQLVMSVKNENIQSKIFCLSKIKKKQTILIDGLEIIRYPLNFEIASTGFSFSALKEFKHHVNEADIIHYHFPWPFADMLHFMSEVKKPTLLTYHSDIVKQKIWLQFYKPLMHAFLKNINVIIATSQHYLNSSAVLQQYSNKVEVIPFGLDPSLYPDPSLERLTYWKSKFGDRFFLFVGVFRAYKGLHVLLNACAGTDFKVVVVGEGPFETALKAQAAELKLHNVHFVGAVSDLDKVALFKLCRAVVFPSHLRSEAFGISLLEGAMFGKPLISCEIATGSSFINRDGETGLVVPPENPGALREAMQCMWDGDRDQAVDEMGVRALERFNTLFRAERMAMDYVRVYENITKNSF